MTIITTKDLKDKKTSQIVRFPIHTTSDVGRGNKLE